MAQIHINQNTCIRCKKCVRICPSALFTLQEDKGIEVNVDDCISCGHCVAVCPTNSIEHADFPPEKVHTIDRSQLPTADQVELLIRSRRSNRAFSKEKVSEELLQRIIEAAHRAPTATNAQEVKMVLVTRPETLEEVSRITIGTFMSIVNLVENPLLKLILKPLMPSGYRYVPVFKRLHEEFGCHLFLYRQKRTFRMSGLQPCLPECFAHGRSGRSLTVLHRIRMQCSRNGPEKKVAKAVRY